MHNTKIVKIKRHYFLEISSNNANLGVMRHPMNDVAKINQMNKNITLNNIKNDERKSNINRTS